MKNKFNGMFDGESANVFKGMLTLLMGSGFARIVGLLCIPVLTRIYSPDDYGVLALYISFVAILAPVFSLRYVQAIPLPKTDLMAFSLLTLCAKLIALNAIIVIVVFFCFGTYIFSWFNVEPLAPWWWLVVMGGVGTSLYELTSLWATRKKRYRILAKTQVMQSVIGNSIKVVLGLFLLQPVGLIVGQFFMQTAGVIALLKDTKQDYKKYISLVRIKKEKFMALYYQDFVWFRLPSQFLMILSIQAPVMIVAALYGKEITGQLSLAMMTLMLPVGLIGSAMAKAYYAEIASIGRSDLPRIRRITLSIQKKLFLIGIPFAITVYLLSEPLFLLVFGSEWAIAGTFSALLAPFILFQFTSSPLMEVINILGKQWIYLVLNSCRIIGFALIFIYVKQYDFSYIKLVAVLSFYLSFFYLAATVLILYMLSTTAIKRG